MLNSKFSNKLDEAVDGEFKDLSEAAVKENWIDDVLDSMSYAEKENLLNKGGWYMKEKEKVDDNTNDRGASDYE